MSAIGRNSVGFSEQLLQQNRSNNQLVARSIERLSTGKRINRPSDDPGKFVVAESLRGDLIDLRAESRGAELQRLENRQQQSALSQIQRVLTSVRGNLVAAADGFSSPAQNQALQQEIDASLDAIDLIAERVQGVGNSESLKTLRRNGAANVIDGDIAQAAALVDGKLRSLSRSRAALGAYERTQIDTFQQFREDQIAITTQALSQVEDADFAAESANLVKGQILSSASIAALTYANREQLEQAEEILEDLDSV